MDLPLASNTFSDPYLIIAFWVGIGSIAFTIIITAQIVYLRGATRRYERMEKAVIEKWRPLLNAALIGPTPIELPALRKQERLIFLKLWVHLHRAIRGEASDRLNEVAYKLDCDKIARSLMQKGTRAEKLLATMVLGHLRDTTAWPVLLPEAHIEDKAISVHALWALVQINPTAATNQLTPLLLQRTDWAPPQVVNILRDAREECKQVLVNAIPLMENQWLPRALLLVEALRITLPPALLSDLLHSASSEVVIAALRLSAVSELLADVRAHLKHPDWRVRVQAAKALGRIGDRSDVENLKSLLADSHWWVRYRSAQALLGLPFLTKSDIAHLCTTATDRFASDIIRQVIVEQNVSGVGNVCIN